VYSVATSSPDAIGSAGSVVLPYGRVMPVNSITAPYAMVVSRCPTLHLGRHFASRAGARENARQVISTTTLSCSREKSWQCREGSFHQVHRLRAAVLGANDGILSTSSLVVGVAAAHADLSNVLVAGVAGLVAGAMSMAAGEYVSVHSQADTEQAELKRERAELDDKGKHKGLMAIYLDRGLGIPRLFGRVRFQAALASAGSFAVGAAMPLLVTAMAPAADLIPLVSGTSLVFLAFLGGLSAHAGGAGVTMGAIRVTFWGALAMALTAGVGSLFGTVARAGPTGGHRGYVRPHQRMQPTTLSRRS